jgi:hypothetical protein
MPTSRRLAVVIPAGPADDTPDTLASVLHYLEDPAIVVVVDDTGGKRPDIAALRALGPPVVVLPAPRTRSGKHGGLWVKLAAGIRYAVEHAEFDALLRLDADALLIGRGIEKVAAERFAEDPEVGMLGSYRIGPDGHERDFSPAARILRTESGLRGRRHPRLRRLLRLLLTDADPLGYAPGEHALGGAYLLRGETVRALHERGLLDLPALAFSGAGEDHLFGLLTYVAGYRIGDFGGPHDPMALRWKGLPCSPQRLLSEGRLVTHSVRYWDVLGECEIRGFFAAARGQGEPQSRSRWS